jgi:hypothetical protein
MNDPCRPRQVLCLELEGGDEGDLVVAAGVGAYVQERFLPEKGSSKPSKVTMAPL